MYRLRILLLVIVASIGVFVSQPTYAQQEVVEPPKQAQQGGQPQFPNLQEGLKRTPGCLGVETAKTDSGKEVIFAWFENKKAVLAWFNSPMHKGVMNRFFPQRGEREPLAGIPDDSGPIMAIASITFSDQAQFAGTPLPISQIAIELYAPISGGLSLGGRFAPDSMKVEGLNDYSEGSTKGK